MIGWLVAAALLVVLITYHFRSVRRRMYLADYVLLMFTDPTTYQMWRGAFAEGLLSLDPAFRERYLWLHANNYLCRFTADWGLRTDSPAVVEAALKKWLEDFEHQHGQPTT